MKINIQTTGLTLLLCFTVLQSCAAFLEKFEYADRRDEGEKASIASPALIPPTEPQFTPRVTSEKALGWLKNGNIRYVKGLLRADGQSESDRQRILYAQKPHSIILSCSDSHIPPEIIFDQKLGEVFVIRTAAHTVDDAVLASLEYAIAYLGPYNLVVMGHTHCSPIQKTLENTAHRTSPLLDELTNTISQNLTEFRGQSPSSGYRSEAWAHVSGVISEIKLKSPLISERIRSGQLQINPALYDTESGLVEFNRPDQY